MRLSLGPLQYFWPRERVLAFYRAAADWPVEVIYLGETVCSKRRELAARDWLDLAETLTSAGHEVVLSSLALLEAESELAALERLIGNGRCRIEANDLSAVQLCREQRVPFVAGPSLNVYNHRALELLIEDGLFRWVPGVEQGRALLAGMRAAVAADGGRMPELEVIAWGRLPLAWSARCFTARAHDVGKDDCGLRCIEHPDGLPLATREGQPLLTINGVQVQSEAVCDLGPELPELRELGVDLLRLYPQAAGMDEVVRRFRSAIDEGLVPTRAGAVNGYWHGQAGMPAAIA
ncbi:MAG: U32 family peptidase [Gammaproteobacteria bacterium]|nr:U32 family peptidase [Gammaproteobacteria bacterium]